MMKNYYFLFLLFVFASCNQDEMLSIDFAVEKKAMVEDSIPVYEIESENDIISIGTKHYGLFEERLLEDGWVESVDTIETGTRATIPLVVRTDTAYVFNATVDIDVEDPRDLMFKARFSGTMVDSINAYVQPHLRIKKGQRYVCEWRLIASYYSLQSGERCAVRPSPFCALTPQTRDGFTNRGYKGYTNSQYNYFLMTSYQMRILYEDVNHETTLLQIDWPFFKKGQQGESLGYEFIFAVSKRK